MIMASSQKTNYQQENVAARASVHLASRHPDSLLHVTTEVVFDVMPSQKFRR